MPYLKLVDSALLFHSGMTVEVKSCMQIPRTSVTFKALLARSPFLFSFLFFLDLPSAAFTDTGDKGEKERIELKNERWEGKVAWDSLHCTHYQFIVDKSWDLTELQEDIVGFSRTKYCLCTLKLQKYAIQNTSHSSLCSDRLLLEVQNVRKTC